MRQRDGQGRALVLLIASYAILLSSIVAPKYIGKAGGEEATMQVFVGLGIKNGERACHIGK